MGKKITLFLEEVVWALYFFKKNDYAPILFLLVRTKITKIILLLKHYLA